MIDWSPMVKLIHDHQRFLLMTHIKPDCDALGSEIGLAEVLRHLGKTVRIVIVGPWQNRYDFLDPEREIQTFKAANPDFRQTDAVIIVDTGTWNQIGDFGSFLRELPVAKAVIDHHRTQDDLGGIQCIDVQAEATGRLIAELADVLNVPLTPRAATALFTALATDTGWFRHPNTTPETFALAEKFVRLGAIPNRLYEYLYDQNTLPRLRLIGLILERLQVVADGKIGYTEVYLKDFVATGADANDTGDLVNYPRSVAGVEIAAFFTEQSNGCVRISLRSRDGYDVGQVAESLGGGGHRLAAGCSVQGSMADARTKVFQLLLPLVG